MLDGVAADKDEDKSFVFVKDKDLSSSPTEDEDKSFVSSEDEGMRKGLRPIKPVDCRAYSAASQRYGKESGERDDEESGERDGEESGEGDEERDGEEAGEGFSEGVDKGEGEGDGKGEGKAVLLQIGGFCVPISMGFILEHLDLALSPWKVKCTLYVVIAHIADLYKGWFLKIKTTKS
nr:hypothetical protein Iba_chr08bCG5680 [Ipomoea batatas]